MWCMPQQKVNNLNPLNVKADVQNTSFCLL